jgi:serine/threonine protein kinase
VIVPGDVLRNRYRIERSIGRGGMGEVFCAVVLVPPPGREGDDEVTLLRPSVDSFRVAIKVVSRAVVSEAAMARLQREAVAASRIKSEFVPELIDVSTTAEGELFLAMEILYGETLAARLKRRRSLHWEEAFALGDDVLSGLIDAHEAGVVHRDLKPSNIFFCERVPPDMRERAKVLDFGVCKIDTHDEEHLTGTGESVGTASYMAPEQIRGASQVTERADLYSFATVIFEAVSGQLPHAGTGQMAMLASKLERNAMRVADLAIVPVPEGLDTLLARLLARDPAKRYATAREVRDAWRALGPPLVVPRSPSAPPPPGSAPLLTETGVTSGTLEVARRPVSRVGIALAAFSVTVSLVVILVMIGSRRSATAAPDDFAAPSTEPVVSAMVVERPPPAPFEPLPAVADNEDEAHTDDAGASTAADAAVTVAPLPRPAAWHPPRRWGRPPLGSGTTKPHIGDKPRY